MHISDLMPKTGLYDSHCHMIFREYPLSTKDIITKSQEAGLTLLLNVSTDLETSKQVQSLEKESNSYVKSFIGVDPQEVIPNPERFMGLDLTQKDIDSIKEELKGIYLESKDSIIGIGETGMDFYWTKELDKQTKQKSINLQKLLYIAHLELAEEFNLPLTIHSRGAETECLDVLKSITNQSKGVFHSFTGSYEQAKAIIDSGNGLGVNGISTFKSAENLRKVYKKLMGKVNSDVEPEFFYKKGIFFETDSPFLSPEGNRGEVNYPFNVKEIYTAFIEFLSQY